MNGLKQVSVQRSGIEMQIQAMHNDIDCISSGQLMMKGLLNAQFA